MIKFLLILFALTAALGARSQSEDILGFLHLPIRRQMSIVEERVKKWETFLRNDSLKKDSIQLPLKEFILFTLYRNQIASGDDAIEFIYSLDSSLRSRTTVPLSYQIDFPKLPRVAEIERSEFLSKLRATLIPDPSAETGFYERLDSFNRHINRMAKSTKNWELYNTVSYHLNQIALDIRQVNNLVLQRINYFISELIRYFTLPASEMEYHIGFVRKLALGLENYITIQFNYSTYNPVLIPDVLASTTITSGPSANISKAEETTLPDFGPDILKPFEIILWRQTKNGQETSGLTRKFHAYYIEDGMFNEKDPQKNRLDGRDVSTSIIMLANGIYKFWAISNENNKIITKPTEVATLDAYLNSKNNWPFPVNFAILIKVN